MMRDFLISYRSTAISFAAALLVAAPLLVSPAPASAQFLQQGPKLVGSGAIPNPIAGPFQGESVALSADGSTAITGAASDDYGTGAVWIFTRNDISWTQQGSKLIGKDALGIASQGRAVGLSADGNTAIVGGSSDNGGVGAAWIFIRSNGVWSQQGDKLVGSGVVGRAGQGGSVALSADGNTALVGGSADGDYAGAAWVFVRSNNVWTQQGNKLTGSDAVGKAGQSGSVALSADGNIAILGGIFDASEVGAAWVFTRSGNVWSQQGGKLVGSGTVGKSRQGESVALSGDGNTALVGGSADDDYTGAAWVFVRSAGVWVQQGAKLIGSGAVGTPDKGTSVALSADGNTALVGGPFDASYAGAVWVFTRSGGVWTQQGGKLVGTGAVGDAMQGQSVALSADGGTAIVGGPEDDSEAGAVWMFTQSVNCAALVQGIESMNSGSARARLTGIERGLTRKRLARCVADRQISLEQGQSLKHVLLRR